jgi:hypothetical protein
MKKFLAFLLPLFLSLTLTACYSVPRVQTRPKDVGAWSHLCFSDETGGAFYMTRCTVRPLKWEKFPLVVAYDLGEHPETRKSLFYAEKRIEQQTQRDMIDLHHVSEYEVEGEEALRPEFDVLIVFDTTGTRRDSVLGYARHAWRDGRLAAMIGVVATPPPVGMVNLLMHELGHVFGLRHDDLRSSLMYPSLNPESNNFKKFTKKDIGILRKL